MRNALDMLNRKNFTPLLRTLRIIIYSALR
jgi:hypothetical protein